MNGAPRSGFRYSLMTVDMHADPAWGRWPETDLPDAVRPDDQNVAVRIVDFDGGGVYVVKLANVPFKDGPRLAGLWRAPQDSRRSYYDVTWRSENEIAARAQMYLRRSEEWLLAHEGDEFARRGWLQYAEEEDVMNGPKSLEEVAQHVRLARAKGEPIAAFFTAERGHPWAWSIRTAKRRIAEAKAAGLLPEETGKRGPGGRPRPLAANRKEH